MRDRMDKLEELRDEIDRIDAGILELIKNRLDVGREIGKLKKEKNMAVRDKERERLIIKKVRENAKDAGIPQDNIERIFNELIRINIKIEDER